MFLYCSIGAADGTVKKYEFILIRKPAMKPVRWVGSSKRDFLGFPDAVIDVVGFALYLAQVGRKHDRAKPLKGFGGSGVLEMVEDHDGDTYRAVYTVRYERAVYVLHAFQKKSPSGSRTARQDIELVRRRLKDAEAYEAR
jgi:phage-related protein